MKAFKALTLVLVIAGALNWGLLGLFQIDLVATLFGGPQTTLSRIIYIVVGLSGLYQLGPLIDSWFGAADPADLHSSGQSSQRTSTGTYPDRDGPR